MGFARLTSYFKVKALQKRKARESSAEESTALA